MQHHVGDDPKRLVGVLREEVRRDVRIVIAAARARTASAPAESAPAELHSDEVDLLGNLLRSPGLGAPAQQLLGDGRDAWLAVRILEAPRPQHDRHGGQRQLTLLDQQQHQPVRQLHPPGLRQLIHRDGVRD